MKEYFLLQFKLFDRKIADFGIKPKIIVYILLITIFILSSISTLSKITYGAFIYTFLYTYLIHFLNNRQRNDFLKIHLKKRLFINIRIAENLLISIPFITFLLIYQQLLASIILLTFSILLALVNLKKSDSITIPTPFSKRPFEFIVGFRRIFWVFPILYFLAVMAIYSGNDRLGFFSLGMIFLVIGMSFYTNPEDEFFIWVHSQNPQDFLLEKFKIASIQSVFCYLPSLIALSITFPNSIHLLLIIVLAGYFLIASSIFMKYAAYPMQIDIGSVILLVTSILFLPLLAALPFLFFIQAKNKLSNYLK